MHQCAHSPACNILLILCRLTFWSRWSTKVRQEINPKEVSSDEDDMVYKARGMFLHKMEKNAKRFILKSKLKKAGNN